MTVRHRDPSPLGCHRRRPPNRPQRPALAKQRVRGQLLRADDTQGRRPATLRPLYDRHSLAALKEDIRTVATAWFTHEAHASVDEFACHYPLAYNDFGPNDRYASPSQYEMSQLFQVFLLKVLHGWDNEMALLEYLDQ